MEGGNILGICTIMECFQSVGNTLVEREELKMRERETEMAIKVDLSMISGPVNLSARMKERRPMISCREHRSSGGQVKGGVGGMVREEWRGCVKTGRKEVIKNISY